MAISSERLLSNIAGLIARLRESRTPHTHEATQHVDCM